MKKIGLVLILALGIVFANAQDNKTKTTGTTKSTITTKATTTTTPASTNKETVVKTTELPKAIQEDLTKNYASYTVKTAYKIDKSNVITYKILVTKGATELALMYDSAGKLTSSKVVPKTTTTKPLTKGTTPTKANNKIKKDTTN